MKGRCIQAQYTSAVDRKCAERWLPGTVDVSLTCTAPSTCSGFQPPAYVYKGRNVCGYLILHFLRIAKIRKI